MMHSSALGKITRNRHMILSGATVLFTCALLLGFYHATMSLKQLSNSLHYGSRLKGFLLSCRVSEENFIADKELRHVNDFLASFEKLSAELEKLSEVGDVADNSRAVEFAENTLKEYRGIFLQIVEKEKIIGLEEASGLRGSLRNTIFRVEDMVTYMDNREPLVEMLQCRRYEKDFIIRKTPLYVEKFDDSFRVLLEELEKSGLDERVKEQALILARTYSADFHLLVDAVSEVGFNTESGLRGRMEETAERIEKAMQEHEKRTLRQHGQLLEYLPRIIQLFLLLSLLTLTLLIRLLQFNSRLRNESRERSQAQEDLQRANETLEQRVVKRTEEISQKIGELTRHKEELALINEMTETLQACRSLDEMFSVIGSFGAGLFPLESGTVFLFDNTRALLEPSAGWGESGQSVRGLPPDECWGLRKGVPHLGGGEGHGLNCAHVAGESLEDGAPYMCVPMISQGELIGLLHLCRARNRAVDHGGPGLFFHKAKQSLIVAVAENLAISIANMQLRETLKAQTVRDPLTGLYNRRFLDETLEREASRALRREAPMAVVMIDIDHFKSYNDRFGHDAGDAVLRGVANSLTTRVRKGDIVCRFGGEEFTVIMPEISLEKAVECAERLRGEVAACSFDHRGTKLDSVTVSLGIAMFPDHSRRVEAVVELADGALYRAKEEGRNRVAIHVP